MKVVPNDNFKFGGERVKTSKDNKVTVKPVSN